MQSKCATQLDILVIYINVVRVSASKGASDANCTKMNWKIRRDLTFAHIGEYTEGVNPNNAGAILFLIFLCNFQSKNIYIIICIYICLVCHLNGLRCSFCCRIHHDDDFSFWHNENRLCFKNIIYKINNIVCCVERYKSICNIYIYMWLMAIADGSYDAPL